MGAGCCAAGSSGAGAGVAPALDDEVEVGTGVKGDEGAGMLPDRAASRASTRSASRRMVLPFSSFSAVWRWSCVSSASSRARISVTAVVDVDGAVGRRHPGPRSRRR